MKGILIVFLIILILATIVSRDKEKQQVKEQVVETKIEKVKKENNERQKWIYFLNLSNGVMLPIVF